MRYIAAIEKNPHWQADDIERARQLLIQKLARECTHTTDAIQQRVRYEERDGYLIANYDPQWQFVHPV